MPRTPDDLAAHDCIIFDPGFSDEGLLGPHVWKFVRDGAEVAITVQPRLVVSNLEAACDAARAGIGLTQAFSYHVEAAAGAGTLTTVLDEFQPPTRPVSFVYTAGRFMPIKLRAFLDFAAPRLKTRLA